MIKKTYAEKLKDPRWQKKRLEILGRDNFSCIFCGDNTETLHVHHKKYTNGEPWDIDSKYLVTLCESCHSEETITRSEADKELINAFCAHNFSSYDISRIAKGVLDIKLPHAPEVTAAMLQFAFTSQCIMDYILDVYISSGKEKKGEV